jgi:hypothetical protein
VTGDADVTRLAAGVTMTDHVSAQLKLRCPNQHDLGSLIKHRGQTAITYAGFPWGIRIHDGFFGFPVCPGGCQHEVAEMPEKLDAILTELANDPDKDEESYTLNFMGPPREMGRITELGS